MCTDTGSYRCILFGGKAYKTVWTLYLHLKQNRCTEGVHHDSTCAKEQTQASLSAVRLWVLWRVGPEGGTRWSFGVLVTMCHDPWLFALMGSVWENSAN